MPRTKERYDFGGWATRNNLRCSDGRIICKNAFAVQDGTKVPLVWNHMHDGPENVLGHGILENDEDGVRVYCSFNNTAKAQDAKEAVRHGDIEALSIYANQLKQAGAKVLHGAIREVSLVYAGANPGAYIDSVMMHGEESDDEAIIYTGMELEDVMIEHSDDEEENAEEGEEMALQHADEGKEKEQEKKAPEAEDKKDGETVKDVFDTLNEKQKTVVYAMIGQALEDAGKGSDDDEDEGGKKDMKHNAFESGTGSRSDVLCHADQEEILKLAKNPTVGTFKNALDIYASENDLTLQHDISAGGFVQEGDGNVTYLFPEYKDVRPGAPELITNDQGWISIVLNKVHKSPISRIRTRQVDIRSIEALRAKGYQKGKQKQLSGNFKLVQRTTDPQTVYVRNQLHKDDITDITEFDYVQYLYNIDRMMLNEELATAILLGDGRDEGDADKIFEEHIRPIWTDDDLYTIHADLDLAGFGAKIQGSNTTANFGENYITAEAFITKMLYTREKYRGSGQPDLFITPHFLNIMLLARDINGRRIYSSKAELASALNVGEIYTAEQFENKTREVTDGTTVKTKKLVAIVANLADYSLGSTKGGEISHFTQFDIDFNSQKSLIETRVSGALTRVYSAIVIEEDVTA